MSGNARLYPDNAYTNGATLGATFYRGIDTAQYQAINAKVGGAWTPSAQIVVGGSGMACAGPWSVGSAPSVQGITGGTARLTHGDSDWVQFGAGHPGSSRQLRTSLGGAADTSYGLLANSYQLIPQVLYEPNSHGAIVYPTGVNLGGARVAMPLRVHNGGSLSNVIFYIMVGNAHAGGVPASMPQMRVLRVDMFGNALPLCNTPTTPGWQGNGWVSFFGTNIGSSTYYNSGHPQTAQYPVDAASAVVDTSRYAYIAQVTDEYGQRAIGGNIHYQALAAHYALPDLRPQ